MMSDVSGMELSSSGSQSTSQKSDIWMELPRNGPNRGIVPGAFPTPSLRRLANRLPWHIGKLVLLDVESVVLNRIVCHDIGVLRLARKLKLIRGWHRVTHVHNQSCGGDRVAAAQIAVKGKLLRNWRYEPALGVSIVGSTPTI